MQKLIKEYPVPPPDALPEEKSKECISEEKMEEKAYNRARYIASQFLEYAQRVKVDVTLEDLHANRSNKPSVLEAQNKYCDEVLTKKPITPFSTIYEDRNGKLLAAYMGQRWKPEVSTIMPF